MERGVCEVSERCQSESTYVGSLVIIELAHGHFDIGTGGREQSTTTCAGGTTCVGAFPVDEPQPLHCPNSSSCAPIHRHHPPRPFSVQVALQRLLALEKPVKVLEDEHDITTCSDFRT